MTTEHPITPPPELVEQWCHKWTAANGCFDLYLATQAAHWAADQELEACCKVLHQHDRAYLLPSQLRAARRPKPPSLAEQALAKTEAILNDPSRVLLTEEREALELNRRALERLQELEQQENNDN